MIDILIPKKVPLFKSKEIHGRVQIDLHNTRSGSNERIEAHNVVTNAVDEFMLLNYFSFMRYNSGARYGSVYAGLFGGVCLFEDQIGGGNMLPLGANKLVGYAGDSATISGNRGYFNSAESSFNGIAGIARSVWDWGTSQANGTINAVARTSSSAGNGSFGITSASNELGYALPQDMTDTSGNRFAIIGIDKADDKIFLFKSSNKGIYSAKFTPTFRINDGGITTSRFPRSMSEMTLLCTSSTNNAKVWWYNPTTKKIHWVGLVTAGTSQDGVIRVYEIDTTAITPSETYTDITLVGTRLVNSWAANCCSGGYIYLYGYNPGDVSEVGFYRVDMSDYTDIQFYNLSTKLTALGYPLNSIYDNWIQPWGVAGMCAQAYVYRLGTYYYCEVCMDKDGNFMFGGITEPNLYWSTSKFTSEYPPVAAGDGVDTWMMKTYQYYHYTSTNDTRYTVRNDFNYMATICNLGIAVTKTSSETMKLTYTLSDT